MAYSLFRTLLTFNVDLDYSAEHILLLHSLLVCLPHATGSSPNTGPGLSSASRPYRLALAWHVVVAEPSVNYTDKETEAHA